MIFPSPLRIYWIKSVCVGVGVGAAKWVRNCLFYLNFKVNFEGLIGSLRVVSLVLFQAVGGGARCIR